MKYVVVDLEVNSLAKQYQKEKELHMFISWCYSINDALTPTSVGTTLGDLFNFTELGITA